MLFPKGMDANEYALKVTPAQQSLAVVLNNAEWWGTVKSRSAAKERLRTWNPREAPEPVAAEVKDATLAEIEQPREEK